MKVFKVCLEFIGRHIRTRAMFLGIVPAGCIDEPNETHSLCRGNSSVPLHFSTVLWTGYASWWLQCYKIAIVMSLSRYNRSFRSPVQCVSRHW